MLGWRAKRVAKAFLSALGREDLIGIARLLDEDVVYTDSKGNRIEGREDCLRAVGRMFEMGTKLVIYADEMSWFGGDVLIRGRCSSPVEWLNADCLWRIAIRGGKIARYQSYRSDNPPAFAKFLTAA